MVNKPHESHTLIGDPFAHDSDREKVPPNVVRPSHCQSVGVTKYTPRDRDTSGPDAEPVTGNASPNLENGSGKQKRFHRMTSWFGNCRSNVRAQPQSTLRVVSGFGSALPHRSISNSGDSSAELWSLDDLLERWIMRSSGGVVMMSGVVLFNNPFLDIIKDNQFQAIFLSTYPAFTNCMEVFRGLRLCFDAASTSGLTAQARAFRRQRYRLAAIGAHCLTPCCPASFPL